MKAPTILGIIPARGGSKGVPRKNLRLLGGLPLIAHSIRFAQMCKEITNFIVSTDDPEIAEVARFYGADVPFLRPQHLACDDTPMIPVLKHSVDHAEESGSTKYDLVLLLDPTSPGRIPDDLSRAVDILMNDMECVGVIAVSEPHFPARWNLVEDTGVGIRYAFSDAGQYVIRQQVKPLYRINGMLYLWRREFLVESPPAFLSTPNKHRGLLTSDERAIHIDSLRDFEVAEILLRSGLIKFPWLTI